MRRWVVVLVWAGCSQELSLSSKGNGPPGVSHDSGEVTATADSAPTHVDTAPPSVIESGLPGAPTGETGETGDTVPATIPELCNGIDDDGDGEIDETYGDTDGDGIADCVDDEICNGDDDNGNGHVDEGYDDTDGDGIADCIDVEECDGVDNDGDIEVDEGFPDTDGDGIADCDEVEDCNGKDDDGDGEVDEGFPTGADGEPLCCSPGDFFLTRGGTSTADVDIWYGDGDLTFSGPARFVSGDTSPIAIGTFDDAEPSPQVLLRDRVTGDVSLRWCDHGTWASRTTDNLPRGGAVIADVDTDGCLDLLSWDYPSGYFGRAGTGDGWTARGDCSGGFTEIPTTWDVRFLDGFWSGGTPHTIGDVNGDTFPDLLFWAVRSGGSSTSSAWMLPGDGTGDFGNEVVLADLMDAGNSGFVSDLDGNGAVDWVVGANDDGVASRAFVAFFDPMAGITSQNGVAVPCGSNGLVSSCYGDGAARLHDWDGDDVVDLIVSWTASNGGRASLAIYPGTGGGSFGAGQRITPGYDLSSYGFWSPIPSP